MADKTIKGSARIGGETKGKKTKVELAADDGLISGTLYMPDPPDPGTVLTFTVK